jgi:hypothetical protein
MSQLQEIKIPFNKFKLVLFLLGSLVFVVMGFYFLEGEIEPTNTYTRYNSGDWLFGVEVVGPEVLAWTVMLFFGLVAMAILLKLFVQKEAVIITEKELISNSIGFRTKRIPLHLIHHLDIRKYRGNTMIRVHYVIPKWNDPETFLDRTTYINKNTISFDFNRLFDILQERVNLNKRP